MQWVSPEAIAEVMKLHPVPHSLAELEVRISEGLPMAALQASVDSATTSAEVRRVLLARIIVKPTYGRRNERLTVEESEKTARLARVVATVVYMWGNAEDARQFLAAPHPLLDGRVPLDVSLTELGARRVERLLWTLFYGLPA